MPTVSAVSMLSINGKGAPQDQSQSFGWWTVQGIALKLNSHGMCVLAASMSVSGPVVLLGQ